MLVHHEVMGMYEGAGHGSAWWVVYLAVAATTVVTLMLLMLVGVARGSR